MNLRPLFRSSIVLYLLSLSFSPAALKGQYFVKDLELEAYLLLRAPVVDSFARAVLYGNNGGRLYNQVILGHQIIDDTTGFVRFNARISVDTGYANNRVRQMSGDYDHCYFTTMAAHANDYNLHETLTLLPPDCIGNPNDVPEPDIPEENCPVLLDLHQDGFHLSGPNPAVRFDIDADGILDEIAWTQAGEDDAFLCWDRNGNGLIDNGRELFGYATPLLTGSRAIIGYRALADLDQPELGGNRDGKVDAVDQEFRELCAWVDTNRDGVSQSDEIHALDEVNVVALEYDYRTTRLRDSFGNLFRYVSHAKMRSPSGSVRSWHTFDVIFAEAATDSSLPGTP